MISITGLVSIQDSWVPISHKSLVLNSSNELGVIFYNEPHTVC
jgi:hypothetical protein